MFFVENTKLTSLEQGEKWLEAEQMLYDLWQNSADDIGLWCRSFAESWYILCEPYCCDTLTPNVQEKVKKHLWCLIKAGGKSQHIHANNKFLLLGGYCISLFPNLFCKGNGDNEYLEWEKFGLQLLKDAAEQAQTDLLAQVLYLGSQLAPNDVYNAVKLQLASEVGQYFSSNTAIEQYFLDILQ